MTEGYNVTVHSQELIGTTEYLALCTRCRINRYRYNRARLYLKLVTEELRIGGYIQATTATDEHSGILNFMATVSIC
jgi:hypothetical protein